MEEKESKLDQIEEKELLAKLEKHLQGKDFTFNPDRKVVENLIKAMVRKREKTGEYYCPCRLVTGDPEEDQRIICPCYYHQFEVERDGHCHCWLFVKKKSGE